MLLLASSVCGLFKWRQFEPEVILLAVGWYLRFSLSYREVEELLAERGLLVDHVTVWRWVQRYAPELERRLRSRLKPTNDSWRVDETYVRVKGKWVYLYRAVDSTGATIDFLLSAKRDAVAAERFLAKALGGENHPAVLGSLAHDRRLRSDSHDPQRPGVRECGGCEGRSIAPFHFRSVRGDELNCRSSIHLRRSSPRLQTCNTAVAAPRGAWQFP